MTFGRTDLEWRRMTPAQLAALSRVHRRVNDPKGRGRGSLREQASPGGLHDLAQFQSMRLT